MIKLAVIGRGNIAKQFIQAVKLTNRFELYAIYSRNEQTGIKFAKENGIQKVYTSLTALANDTQIQAVYIASPNGLHVSQSEQLLRSGKHIICEKPIVTNVKEYCKLKEIADKNGLIYMEAIIPRYVCYRQKIIDALKKIGNISMARIDYCQRSSRYDDFISGKHVNIFDMSLHAGTLMDIGVYCVYGAVDLLGMPNDIVSFSTFLKNGADGSGVSIFRYDGFDAVLTYSKTGQSTVGCEIVGDNGSITIEAIGLYKNAYLIQNGQKAKISDDMTKSELMSFEAQCFADFIDGNNLNDYILASKLCKNVHTCMDKIKLDADIKYNTTEDTKNEARNCQCNL